MGIKQLIVDEYLMGGTSYRQLSKKHGSSRTRIHEWVQEYTGVAPIKRGIGIVPILAVMTPEQTEPVNNGVTTFEWTKKLRDLALTFDHRETKTDLQP